MSSQITALLSLMMLISLVGCENQSASDRGNSDSEYAQAEIVRVVDGDTVIVRLDGREERLRYIGIDAPESVAPDQPAQCFGSEATDENNHLVAGKTVFLESDLEDRDRFGRLLRYVYVTGADGNLLMVNRHLVEQGFAEAGSFPPNVRFQDDLFTAERHARENRLGLWSACP